MEKKHKHGLSARLSSEIDKARHLLDNAGIAVFLLDKQGNCLYANDEAIAHFGYEKANLLTMNIRQLDRGVIANNWIDHWEKVKSSGKLSVETVHCHSSGRNQPVEIKAHINSFADDVLYCAHVIDVNDLELVKRVGSETEERFRQAMDAISDGVWDRNAQTGVVYYGANWARVLGYTQEDLHTGRIVWERLLHPEDKEKTLQALRDHLSGKASYYSAEFRLKNSAGKWQWIYARGKIIEYKEDGSPLRIFGTHTDITSRKELEESLVKNTEETKLFAYSVAHDLRNPALAIRGLVERFSERLAELTDEQRRMYCDRIVDSSDQIVDLVEKINAYISSKETKKNFEDVPLKDVIWASRKEFAAQLQYRSIEWHEFGGNPVIRMDKFSMIRVFRNLIENALKYGGPQLSRIWFGYQDSTSYHIISVQDDGVGMNPEDSERVFRPFERKDSSASQQGSGLGLAIVKEIATNHNGEVWIESNRKQGMKICFAISKSL